MLDRRIEGTKCEVPGELGVTLLVSHLNEEDEVIF